MLQAFEKLSLTNSEHYTQLSSSQLPDILRNSAHIRKLDSLIITNFKSFKGKVYVGPLLSFTSIVGPNGAGKSNVLDALMFCFCNQKSKLTYFDIREFIQREGNQTYQEMAERGHSCEVQAKLILEDGKELLLARTLNAKDQQSFCIDGESYPREAYQSFLMRCNINHRTVNYAIWQGEIDKLLLKDPKDLTAYFQDLSGSSYYRQEQQQVQQKIEQMDTKIQTKSARLVKMKHDKKTLKNISNFKAAKDKIYEEYEAINQKLQMLKAFLSQKTVHDLEKQLQLRETEERQQIKVINERKAKLQREQSQSMELEKKIQALMKQSAEVQHQLKTYDQRNQLLDAQDVKQLSRQIAGMESYLNGLNTKKIDKQNEEQSVQSSEISKEYLQLYGRWQNQNTAANRELSKLKQQYLYLQGILQAKKNVFQEFNFKKQAQEKALQEDKNLTKDILKSMAEVDKNIEALKNEGSRLNSEGEKSRIRAEEVAAQLSKTNEEITDLQVLLSDNSQSQRDKELLKKLNTIQGFRGLLREWIKPVHRKYELCFQLMLGPLLKYLLCVNQTSARQVSLRLREDMQLRTVVILENVKDKKEQINRTELGKLGTPALQIVEVDKSITNLERLLKEFLGGKVLCDNLTAAWTLLGKGVHGIRQIYTLDGDVLRSDGVVSSLGSVEAAKNQYRYLNQPGNRTRLLQDIQKLQKTRMQLQAERDILKKEYEQTTSKNRIDVNKLETRREQLKFKLQSLKKAESRNVSQPPKGLKKEIQELKQRSQNLQVGMRNIELEMSKNPIFSKFLKSHNIQVGSLRNIQDLSSLQSTVRLKFKITRELQQLQREISKVGGQLEPKIQKLQKINKRLKDSRGKKEVPQLQNRLKELQTQLEESKTSLASIKTSSTEDIRFISEVPRLTARLNLAKQQHHKLLKEQISDSSLLEMATNGEYQLLQDGPLKGSSQQLKKWSDELQKQKVSLQNQLDQYSMNITDVNQHHSTEEELKNQTEELKTELTKFVEDKNALIAKLSEVKRDRNRLLVEFLNELKPILSKSYHLLTYNGGDVDARVDIHMENPEFPCQAGLYYNPTPPGKRFVYDLDQLSGGQKSIASLALHYSIAVASKSPLLVLDQTDAFLDSANVSRFLRLVENCVKEHTMQFLVITHKRSLFLVGESLVGVTKPHEDPFSKTYSLFLDEQPQ